MTDYDSDRSTRSEYTDSDILAAIADQRRTTNEIADRLGCYRGTANRRLHELESDGIVKKSPAGKTNLWTRANPPRMLCLPVQPQQFEDFIQLSWGNLPLPASNLLESQALELDRKTRYAWPLPSSDEFDEWFEMLRYGDIITFVFDPATYTSSYFQPQYPTTATENEQQVIATARVVKKAESQDYNEYLWPSTIGVSINTIEDLLNIRGLPAIRFPEPYLEEIPISKTKCVSVKISSEKHHYFLEPTLTEANKLDIPSDIHINQSLNSLEQTIYFALLLYGKNIAPGTTTIEVPNDPTEINQILNRHAQYFLEEYPYTLLLDHFERHSIPASDLKDLLAASDAAIDVLNDWLSGRTSLTAHMVVEPFHHAGSISGIPSPSDMNYMTDPAPYLNYLQEQLDSYQYTPFPAELDRSIAMLYQGLNKPPEERSPYTDAVKIQALKHAFEELVTHLYDYKCAVCEQIRTSPRGVHEATAIRITPENTDESLIDIRNGISLCSLHAWAFNSGWLAVNSNHQLLVRNQPDLDTYEEFGVLSGSNIHTPTSPSEQPHEFFLQAHLMQFDGRPDN